MDINFSSSVSPLIYYICILFDSYSCLSCNFVDYCRVRYSTERYGFRRCRALQATTIPGSQEVEATQAMSISRVPMDAIEDDIWKS